MIVAGIGCSTGCEAAEIVALVRAAERLAGVAVQRLAAPLFRQSEVGLLAAAAELRAALTFIDKEALRAVEPLCPTHSARARAAVGVASVAEGCALAASHGRLILARTASARATCALAEGDGA